MRSSAFVQTAFCQEGFQGEEPERAFQVSPQAIFAAPCQVELPTDRMSAGPPSLETQ